MHGKEREDPLQSRARSDAGVIPATRVRSGSGPGLIAVGVLLAALLVMWTLLAPQSLAAQESAGEPFSVESIDTTLFPINYVYYRHLNEAGENAGSVWEDRITVFEEGDELRAWGDEDGGNVPADLAIVLDSSGSMEGSMDGVLSAAHELIGRLDDRVQP